jgi:phage gp37-like protein
VVDAVAVAADVVASATVAAVVVDVVAAVVLPVAVDVAVLSTVAASATSLARRSLSTKRIVSACRRLYESAKIKKAFGFCFNYGASRASFAFL